MTTTKTQIKMIRITMTRLRRRHTKDKMMVLMAYLWSMSTCSRQFSNQLRRLKTYQSPNTRLPSCKNSNETEFWSSLETQAVVRRPKCQSLYWKWPCLKRQMWRLSAHSQGDLRLSISLNVSPKSLVNGSVRQWVTTWEWHLVRHVESRKCSSWRQEFSCNA